MSPQDATEITPQRAASPAIGRKLGLALLVIATAQLMLVLDDTIVNVALPSMQRSLHLATSNLNWVISFYALAFGGLLLAGGRAGDLLGRRRVFRFGITVFALASTAGGFAPNGTLLVAARVVQGCGAAFAAPCALSLLATTWPAFSPAPSSSQQVLSSRCSPSTPGSALPRPQATEPAVVRYSLVRHTQPVSSFRCVSVFG
jgi:sugar phosphate permease